jgi:hypothetical protein
MALNRSRSLQKDRNAVATVYNSGLSTYEYIYPEDNKIVFDKGRNQSFWDNPAGYGVDYGEFTIFPYIDFKAQVKMWGAGGGAHGSSGGAAGAGGGHAQANVSFFKNIPYVVWVGESGFYNHHSHDGSGNRHQYRSGCSFGGGGGGGHNGGGGGGMSGLFFHCLPTNGGPGHGLKAISTYFRSPGQSNSLLIAGGGGGGGHHSNGHHGQGGGGGGDTANVGHAQANANQHAGGHRWAAGAQGQIGWQFQGGFGGPSSNTGGGGGGWYGGPGGSHADSHHNGGSGGSGHILTNTTNERPNWWIREKYPNIVRNASHATAPGNHGNNDVSAAQTGDSDYINYTGYGGGHSGTFTPNTSSGNNGRVLIRYQGNGAL